MSRKEALDFATEIMGQNQALHQRNLALQSELNDCERRFRGELNRQQLLGTAIPMAQAVTGRGRTRRNRRSHRRRNRRTQHRRNRRSHRRRRRRVGMTKKK
tara:strand:+ start:5081 stop:5383 length:303 start_codon:yes stop_codon:yes gene_type:complete